MSPRVIQIPLSGGDRKHYARELKRAEGLHENLVKQAAETRRIADRFECEEWSVRQFIGGEVEPSPTIAAAINADCVFLCVECRACGHSERIDLTEVVWPRQKPIHTLGRVLVCQTCKREGRSKRRPNLAGLQVRDPDHQPPKAVAKR